MDARNMDVLCKLAVPVQLVARLVRNPVEASLLLRITMLAADLDRFLRQYHELAVHHLAYAILFGESVTI